MTWPIHTSAPSSEFIQYLRDWAISNKVDERFIHKLDELRTVDGLEEQIEEATGRAEDAESSLDERTEERDWIIAALQSLLGAIEDLNLEDRDKLEPYVVESEAAIRRALA